MRPSFFVEPSYRFLTVTVFLDQSLGSRYWSIDTLKSIQYKTL